MKKLLSIVICGMALLFAGCEEHNAPATSNKVETGAASDITTESVVLHGVVNVDISQYDDVEFGMMVSEDKAELNARDGEMYKAKVLIGKDFELTLEGLSPETKYYYCAWVFLNNTQYEFGSIKNFATEAHNSNNPSNTAKAFSISDSKQVTFSQGNLQYTQSTNTWSFAENQWDYIGTDNVIGGSVYSTPTTGDLKSGTALADKIDLFGWSTSTTNFGVSTSASDNNYSGSFVDWGTNVIGTDAAYTWRTLSNSEWIYLFNSRPNARSLYGIAQVAGVNGMIILPDNWSDSISINFKSGLNNNGSGSGYYAVYQSFTAEQWSIMEDAGAVFLPASGFRYGTEIYDFTLFGYYWHKTEYVSESAFYMYFDSGYFGTDLPILRYYGYSVRLAKDVFIDDTPNDPDEPSTPEDPDVPSEDDHEYVDLGLSVKWATCNVGASSPEEYGDYFAWGETSTKSTYNWSTYTLCKGSSESLTKYNTSSSFGTVDNKTVLESEDDVANVKWGKSWRMPTKEEQEELLNECVWKWTTLNGVNGYNITGPNGNSIFLPAAGIMIGSTLGNAGEQGYYWASSCLTSFPSFAWMLHFNSNYVLVDYYQRFYGRTIRPVCP